MRQKMIKKIAAAFAAALLTAAVSSGAVLADSWVGIDSTYGVSCTDYYATMYVSSTIGANVRSAPTSDASLLHTLVYGQQVSVCGKTSNGWYQLRAEDTTNGGETMGYIAASLLSATAQTSQSSGSSSSTSSGSSSSQTSSSSSSTSSGSSSYTVSSYYTIMYVTSLIGANVRTGPSTDSRILHSLSYGQQVSVCGITSNGWYQLRAEDTTYGGETMGYIAASLLSATTLSSQSSSSSSSAGSSSSSSTGSSSSSSTGSGSSSSSVTSYSATMYVISSIGANVRTSPSTDSRILHSLSYGQQISVCGKTSNGWYQLLAEDTTYGGEIMGYIAGNLLASSLPGQSSSSSSSTTSSSTSSSSTSSSTSSTTSSSGSSSAASSYYATMYVSSPIGANVRISPSTDSRILHSLSYGQQVSVCGKTSNGWYQLLAEDTTYGGEVMGYIAGNLLASSLPGQSSSSSSSTTTSGSSSTTTSGSSSTSSSGSSSTTSSGSSSTTSSGSSSTTSSGSSSTSSSGSSSTVSTYYSTMYVSSTAGANVRTSPSSSARILQSLSYGQQVSVCGKTSSGWYQLYAEDSVYGGQTLGYTAGNLLSETNPKSGSSSSSSSSSTSSSTSKTTDSSSSTSTSSSSSTRTVKVSSGYLALRNACSYNICNEIGKLYTGEQVRYIRAASNGYAYVYSPKLKKYGYVNASYLV